MKSLLWFAVACFAFLLQSCGERPPSYESKFHDSVWIYFPPGHPFDGVEPLRAKVDAMLRDKKIGFWSGVMGAGNEGDIEHIELDLDFELVDEHKLVQSLIEDGVLPRNVEVEYKLGFYDDDAN
ncbi:hypothetical protein OAE47_02255 [Akkermansiaceae bacterium]|nr:hypothetical protein [Akkermansiaceae bacterium]MDB4624210.1 hypothetical protein [Akkermansiaceae bacterium]